MKKIIKELGNICKSMSGKLLVIGIEDDSINKIISNNNSITHYDQLSSINVKGNGVFKRTKIITAKKLKKHYHKKRVDNIISSYEHIEETLNHFVYSSIYITKKDIYIAVANNKVDFLVSKYKRYTKKINVTKYDKHSLVVIDVRKLKPNKFKDIYYGIKDTFVVIIDYISDFLVN